MKDCKCRNYSHVQEVWQGAAMVALFLWVILNTLLFPLLSVETFLKFYLISSASTMILWLGFSVENRNCVINTEREKINLDEASVY